MFGSVWLCSDVLFYPMSWLGTLDRRFRGEWKVEAVTAGLRLVFGVQAGKGR